jgi:segregation and condensation protein B
MKNSNINQLEIEEASNKNIYFSVIESLLFAAGEPLKLKDISSILECSTDFTILLIEELSKRYENEDRGIKLIAINDAYQLITKMENSDYVQKLLRINTRQSLSQAALETLAIIAYKQPVTRIEIDDIRGVKSDRAISTLIEKKLTKECGRKDIPGRPIMYGITDEFLKCFGIKELGELPSMDVLIRKYAEPYEEQA